MGGNRRRYQFISVLMAIVMVCTMALFGIKETQAATGTPFASHGRLSVSGTKLVDASGQAYQLRGVSTFNLAWYPQYYTKAAFQSLRDDWGANVVRIVMYPHEYNGYCTVSAQQQASYRASLLQCIKDAYDLGMYAILDWHVLNERDPNVYKSQALAFFKEMSASASGYGNVLYEICNEPNGPAWSSIKSYAVDVIDTIRANDPNSVIIVGTPTWSQDVDTAAADPIARTNIMYTLHFYANTHRDWYRQKAQIAINAGLPLFVTEFGICDASGNGGLDKNEGNTWINFLDQNQISYCMWQLSNKNESASLLSPSCNKTSGWTYNDLSESGKWYYNILTSRREKYVADTYTGLRQQADGSWHYLVNGKLNTGYTGLVLYKGAWFYVEKGILNWNYTGLTLYNGRWYYVQKGMLNWNYTGLCLFNGAWFYVEKGVLNWNYTGLTLYNGRWYYVQKGMLNWNYTDLYLFNGSWYYVQKGVLNENYTGLVLYNGAWFYVERGVLNWNYTGLTLYNGRWYYVQKGMLNWNYTDLYLFNGSWYYVQKGVLNENYTGLVLYNGAWFYVERGVLNWNYTGLTLYNGRWYYVQKGMLNWNYTDLYLFNGSWYYVQKGVLNENYTGLVLYNGAWFYVERGVLNWNYTDLTLYNGRWYYVQKGMLNWNYTGLVLYNGAWFYVEKGVLNWNYTGLTLYNGIWYYVQKGMLDWNYTGEVEKDGITYRVVGGVAYAQ